MSSLENFILSMDNSMFTAISSFLDNSVYFILVVLFILLISEQRMHKLTKIGSALALAVLLATTLKEVYYNPRPCHEEIQSKIECPQDFSFPSSHAVVAFTLMIPFLNKRTYPIYLLFALLVGVSRIYLGVHSVIDVLGALPIAAVSYYITNLAEGGFQNGKKRTR